MQKSMAIVLTGLLWSGTILRSAAADETVRIAVPDSRAWDTAYTELGAQQGIFKEEGLDLQIVHVANEAALVKALASGDADIAVAADFPHVIGAWMNGAPIKVISPEATGAPDMFWYAKMGNPVASIRDLHGLPIGVSRPGTLSHFVLHALLRDAGVADASLVPIGLADDGYQRVLDAELAASWSAPPTLVEYLIAGEIRLIARGDDARSVRYQTVRVNTARADFLADHRSATLGFLRAYKKSVAWAFSGPAAVDAYARLTDQRLEVARYIVNEFTSSAASQVDEIKGEDAMLSEALAANLISRPLTHEDIKEMYDLVLKEGS
ncbi:MAG: ABC transporter substrate-binding protein [Bradyrhizobiaceae bacterium]|nr:ABC transporter substrate-binding protein [Bradyrhizobiaceae bacterium]